MFLLLYPTFILFCLSLTVKAICYFPDGVTVPRLDTPCHSTGESTCCASGYACLSNNLCMLTEHVEGDTDSISTFVRGSCTDRSWNSPNCPSFCVSPSEDFVRGGMGVAKCPVTEDRYYCINRASTSLSQSELCSNSSLYFEFDGSPTTVTIIGVSSTFPTSTSSSSTSTTISTSSTIATSSTTGSSTIPAPASQSSTAASTSEKKDNSVAIGAGVGVPVGLIAIGIAAFLFFRRRHSQKQAPSELPNPAVDGYQQYLTSGKPPHLLGTSGQYQQMHLSPGTYMHEAQGDVGRHEMPENNAIMEMPADR